MTVKDVSALKQFCNYMIGKYSFSTDCYIIEDIQSDSVIVMGGHSPMIVPTNIATIFSFNCAKEIEAYYASKRVFGLKIKSVMDYYMDKLNKLEHWGR